MGVKWPYFAKMTPPKKNICLRRTLKRPTNTPNTRNGRVITKIKTVIAGAGSSLNGKRNAEIPRTLKKFWEKKKVIKTTPTKGTSHCLLCWPTGVKKKVGVKQEKVGHVGLENVSLGGLLELIIAPSVRR